MIILAVESSCDETAVAITRDGREVLADEIFSQADMHALYGGVVPEIASRNHINVISKLADSALTKAGLTKADIDAVAVTYAPGLIGALLVGLNFAKGLALSLGVPLIPVHHIAHGHDRVGIDDQQQQQNDADKHHHHLTLHRPSGRKKPCHQLLHMGYI